MKPSVLFENNAFKYALSMGLAMAIAVVVSAWFDSRSGWVLLTVWFIAQMNREAPLRQGLIIVSLVLLAVLASAFLQQFLPWPPAIYIVIALLFLAVQMQAVWYLLLFFIAFSLADVNYAQNIIDVLAGAIIALLCRQIIFPLRLGAAFSQELLPVMKALHAYSDALVQRLFLADGHCDQQKQQLVQALQWQYPEWVYTVGFNPGLRKGLRYFLLKLERLIEVYFSLQYLADTSINPDLLSELKETVTTAMRHNQSLIEVLIHYFEHRQIKDSDLAYTQDIAQMEEVLQRLLPAHIDLIDIAPDYILLTALARDVKDAREILLQLVMTLQGE